MFANAPPRLVNIAQKPRRPFGECSEVNRAAPAHSPPAARPCAMRSRTRTIGATMPMLAAVGSRPINTVDAPISDIVAMRVRLRPRRSPKCPNRMEPNGRATKATPRVAYDTTLPACSPRAGKNAFAKTSAAAVA